MLRASSAASMDELAAIIAAASGETLGTLILAVDSAEAAAVAAAGATAVICEGEARLAAEDGGGAPAPVDFGLWWDGSAGSLAGVRSAGFERVYIEDACAGDMVLGAGRCTALLSAAQSKKSSQWSGSMFGVSDNDPPERRNPLAWAQSKRQAREIMHESAKSRGLPPPQLRHGGK